MLLSIWFSLVFLGLQMLLGLSGFSRSRCSMLLRFNNKAVCVYIYIYVCVCVCMHIYMQTYLLVPAYLPTYLPTYLHTYIHTYIHTFIRTYIHIVADIRKYGHSDIPLGNQAGRQPDMHAHRGIFPVHVHLHTVGACLFYGDCQSEFTSHDSRQVK